MWYFILNRSTIGIYELSEHWLLKINPVSFFNKIRLIEGYKITISTGAVNMRFGLKKKKVGNPAWVFMISSRSKWHTFCRMKKGQQALGPGTWISECLGQFSMVVPQGRTQLRLYTRYQDFLVFCVAQHLPSCLPSGAPAIIRFVAGCPLELSFFDVCAWILAFGYFDILHFQQLWAKHLQAVRGFILLASRTCARSLMSSYLGCQGFQNA